MLYYHQVGILYLRYLIFKLKTRSGVVKVSDCTNLNDPTQIPNTIIELYKEEQLNFFANGPQLRIRYP